MTFPSFIPQDQYPGSQKPSPLVPLDPCAQAMNGQHPSLESQITPPTKPNRSPGYFIHNILLLGILVGGGMFGYHALKYISTIVDQLGSNFYTMVPAANSTVAAS